MECLGHTLLLGRLAAASKNVAVIKTAIFPTDSMKIKPFLGACNVYRKFIEHFCKNIRPHNEYFQKDEELDWLDPTNEPLDDFNKLKSKMVGPPVLVLFQQHRSYMIDPDASAYALGAVLR